MAAPGGVGAPSRDRGGVRAAEGSRVGITFFEFVVLAAQLAALLVVVRFYGIESERGYVHATPILFVGFAVHAWLPLAWRLPFFVVLTAALVVVLLGPVNGAILILLALGIVGLCHLPAPMWARVAAILALGGALAAIHLGRAATDWSAVVIPVLGSIFMFRLMLYLYDLATHRSPATVAQRLGYFFLVPNPFFPLFPVVDYATYLRSYYARDAVDIYQKGMSWILRG
ncbi:MAG TPA: hypothetical protein VM778_10270, partial [Gemmatimonadota bacterium]|nr:hypothetical protein [Gemmatimonadota bacterium]